MAAKLAPSSYLASQKKSYSANQFIASYFSENSTHNGK